MSDHDKNILNAFLNVLPPYARQSTGWLTFNCPSCGDQRGRGAFLVTNTQGWRFSCRNGGCDFNTHPTGWEPDSESGLGGNPRKLFRLLGGQIRDLPIEEIFKRAGRFSKQGVPTQETEESAVYYFEKIDLPEGAVPLLDPGEFIDDEQYQQVLTYLVDRRAPEFIDLHPFYWSPHLPAFLIIPYIHNRSMVGYLARNTLSDTKNKMYQKCNSDYLFNQQVLLDDNTWAILCEGVLDGIAVGGVSTRGTSITKKQELLLNLSAKDIIVLPDQQADGLNLVECAERNNWYVSSPIWDRGVKDASQALNQYGMLYTIESVRANAHKNYLKAKTSIKLRK